jgi:diguanylate cyclase (GGDEF)-like protein/PAS domain S-box-containing protein
VKPKTAPVPPDANAEISALIKTLLAAGQRLEELTAGEVDTVADRDGRTFLLRSAQEQLRHSEAARQAAILNALPAHIALLDAQGIIISINEAWRRFAGASAVHGPNYGIGLNYLEVCDMARGDGSGEAHQIAQGIRSVLSGGEKSFSIEYPNHSPTEQRWFLFTATPLANNRPNGVVVTHLNITEQKRAKDELRESERRFSDMFGKVDLISVMLDREGRLTYCNDYLLRLTGWRREEVIGRDWFELFIPSSCDLKDRFAAVLADLPSASHHDNEILTRSGGQRLIQWTNTTLRSASGEVIGTASIGDDITERNKDAEQHRAQMEDRYRALLEAAPDAMVVVNDAGGIVLLNVQAEKQFGYRRDELVGQQVTNIIPTGFAERLIADALRSAEEALAQQMGTGMELTGQRKNGSGFPIEILLSPLESAEGTLVTAAIRDISARKRAEAQMIHWAQHDFLTDLPNRFLLNDRIDQAIALAQRHRKQVAVLFLDLDGFKYINDSLGHSIGDRLLQSIAKRLEQCVRAPDTVSRQGGDEFVVLVSEEARWVDAAIVAARILRSVAEAHSIDQHDLHVTASIGVSVYPDDGMDAETLIKNADTAMYNAKENGRQSYQFFKPEMNVRAVERQSIEEGLRRALERREFTLHYQPKINLGTGAITGAEALIRWTHPTRGPLLPAQFIPIAEECGLIRPIGSWVLREACRQARAWVDAGLPVATMAVNVSAMQLRQETFLQSVFAILQDTGLDPGSLELELTEGVLMKHAESTAATLQALREKGVRVAVDDFGTGYSSLSYLKKFPIDALKIDQSFVRQIGTAGDDAAIVTAVISMARSLKLLVIAEGVETQEQLEFLQTHQCEEGQGYYFSRPVPAEQFSKLLETGCCLAWAEGCAELGYVDSSNLVSHSM